METQQQPTTAAPQPEKKWILPTLYTAAGIGAIAMIALFALQMLNNTSLTALREESTTNESTLSTLQSNKAFLQHRILAKHLSPPKKKLGDFLSTMSTTLESYGRVNSADITKNEESEPAVVLLLESSPPLTTVADLLERIKGLTNIHTPHIDTITSSQNELGQFVYTYPISFTLAQDE